VALGGCELVESLYKKKKRKKNGLYLPFQQQNVEEREKRGYLLLSHGGEQRDTRE
jgi:hypothetical protein